MLRITMLSGIIKGSPTSCCSLGSRKLVATTLCNVARGWVGSCVITIKRLRELAGKSRTMPVRLAAELHLCQADALLTTMIAGERTSWLPHLRLRDRPARMKDRDSNQRGSFPRSNRQEPRINILAIRDAHGV